ncbi:MAG: RsfS/YbeB/iojap family protein, partial [Clostridiales bacterium]|nr:RsfS/YbeB/iojap family protein [Clostridiales bacterium]
YGTVIVHIFHPEDREFYRLERLWSDGSNRLVLPFEEEGKDDQA